MFIASQLMLKCIAYIGLIPFSIGMFKAKKSSFKEGKKVLFIGLFILILPGIIHANYPALTWLIQYNK